ncbi:hypothetical protein FIBSPDRAFT_948048 [Athelia psychrophila]|uniref:Uncharacterized protein n=1 Tax=Athelia psychrophila TaxID=1759441 RepID=A0A166RDJ6_9AGAM|nr:hypothetical protein FIBSPDRAFT_948048 [Fibularhizoctonia sp. CBS 109695]
MTASSGASAAASRPSRAARPTASAARSAGAPAATSPRGCSPPSGTSRASSSRATASARPTSTTAAAGAPRRRSTAPPTAKTPPQSPAAPIASPRSVTSASTPLNAGYSRVEVVSERQTGWGDSGSTCSCGSGACEAAVGGNTSPTRHRYPRGYFGSACPPPGVCSSVVSSRNSPRCSSYYAHPYHFSGTVTFMAALYLNFHIRPSGYDSVASILGRSRRWSPRTNSRRPPTTVEECMLVSVPVVLSTLPPIRSWRISLRPTLLEYATWVSGCSSPDLLQVRLPSYHRSHDVFGTYYDSGLCDRQ